MSAPAIVFIGFMGAGKSTALAAARRAGLETTEIDDLMAAAFGMPITEAFEKHGEDGFRAREAAIVGELLEKADGGAIALGGGSILSQRVRAALPRHTVVWIQVDAKEAWRRIAHSDRPLASSAADVERLLATRLPLYEELADAVVPVGDREIVARALTAIQALAELPTGSKLLWAATASGDYPIFVGRGLLGAGWWPLASRRFCLTDSDVGALYVDRLEPLVGTATVAPGEEAKTLAETERVLRLLATAGMRRDDHLVALGGGVIGDLGGFCAHIYQRGVSVVQVPTTFVSQVDSAYGGKTGVDLPEGKNYVGAFQQPSAVLADTSTLDSLPSWELESGFVEALKTGLLAGGTLWERVRSVETIEPDLVDQLVFACARYKSEVVAEDERETGRRAVLNLGHTVGHGIETGAAYTHYSHGEAIGLGLLAALRLSDAPQLRAEVEAILQRLNLPVRLRLGEDGVEAILDALQRDKKRTAAGVGFVLLSEPGAPRVGQLIDPARVRSAVEELLP
ncbi:MAG: bifunctional shikimate kinase/3-dehydroquinate synthase [Solirubrobacterales bacterium]|nr:bifunctional shikimate kinase/3-dehydroquinate synthase [Solirubrobacterales bacterium]